MRNSCDRYRLRRVALFLARGLRRRNLALVSIGAACALFYANVSFPLVLIGTVSMWSAY